MAKKGITIDRSDPAWQQRLLSMPPLRDQHGRRLLLLRTGVWNPDKADFRQASPWRGDCLNCYVTFLLDNIISNGLLNIFPELS